MRHKQLQNIIQQYFPGQMLAYDIAPSVMLEEARPNEMDEPDVQSKIIDLFTATSSWPPTSIVRASTWCFHRTRS